jgi:hypothetical protein
VISDMLGVPAQDQDRLREWLEISVSVGAHRPEEIQAALGQLRAYLTDLIAAKRATPANDLLSALIAARDDDDRLSEAELVSTLFILISAGYETTAGLLANSITVLSYHHPDQLALLRDKPELLPAAVEERCAPRVFMVRWSIGVGSPAGPLGKGGAEFEQVPQPGWFARRWGSAPARSARGGGQCGHVVRGDDVDVGGPGVAAAGQGFVGLHDGVAGAAQVLVEVVVEDG